MTKFNAIQGIDGGSRRLISSNRQDSGEDIISQANGGVESFMAQHGKFIEAAVAALTRFRDRDAGKDAIKAYSEFARAGEDASSGTGIQDYTADLFREDPDLGSVFNEAYKQGMRGLGLGVDADGYAFAWGGRAGAEGLVQFPYRVGTYTTSTEVKGRYWYTRSKGTGLGFSVSLGLTVFLVPPLSTDRFFGVYFGYLPIVPYPIPVQRVVGFGAQVEIFSWIPQTDGALQSSDIHPMLLIWKSIFGFRIAVDAGVDLVHALALTQVPFLKWTAWTPLIGTFKGGTQQVSDAVLKVPTYTMAPTAIAKQEDGTDVTGTLTAPVRAGEPSRVFRTADESSSRAATTLKITFPSWLGDYLNTLTTSSTQLFTISSTGSAESQTYNNNLPASPWKIDTSTLGSQQISLTWVGKDEDAWAEKFTFTLTGVTGNSGQTTPAYGFSLLNLAGVQSLYTLVNVPYSFNGIQMGLVETLFKASLVTKLDISKAYMDDFKLAWIPWSDSGTTDESQWVFVDESQGHYIDNGDTWEFSVSLDTDNSQSPQTDSECRLVFSDSLVDSEGNPLALALIPPSDGIQTAYYCGYVFQQQGSGQQVCQLCSVLWQMGTPFRSRNYYGTDYETLKYNQMVSSKTQYDGSYYGSAVVWEIDATQTYPTSS